MEQAYLIISYILVGAVGLCVGSFLNVVIYRLPEGMSLATPGSHCPKCQYALRWYDNIPLLSYLILGGRCRRCKVHIPFRYTAVELANTLLWLLCAFLFREESIPLACLYMLAMSVFLCIFFIDLEHMIIYDRFQVLLLLIAAASIFFDKSFGWLSHLIGGVAGFAVFYLICVVFTAVAKKEGLGGGDIKLAGVAGLLLGWERLLLSMLLATIPAAVIMSILLRRTSAEEEQARQFPFAPFLVSGFAISLLFGEQIIHWYLSLLGIHG